VSARVPNPGPERLRELHAEHRSAEGVGSALGVSTATAWRWLRAAGIASDPSPDRRRGGTRKRGRPAPKPVSIAQAEALRALHAAEPRLTYRELAERIGLECSIAYVGQILAGRRRVAS